MAFQPAPDCVEVVFHAVQNGVPIVNVYNVECTGTIDDAKLESIADTFHDWWNTQMKPNQHTSYILNDITATDISVEGGHQFVLALTSGNAGTSSSEPMSGQAAAVVSWRTARIGRSYRGRTYFGGGTVGWTVDAQHLDPVFTAGLGGIATNLLDALVLIDCHLVVLSRFLHKVARVAAVLTRITSFIIDTVVDTQRRRTAN